MTLIIYDIRNDKRRRKTVKLLESFGIRVQYSAFECSLTASALDHITTKLKTILSTEDSLRIYSFNDNTAVTDIGQMPRCADIQTSGYVSI